MSTGDILVIMYEREEISYRPDSILDTLGKEQYSEFIKIDEEGTKRNPFIISITEEGKEFLMLIENIREVYNEKCKKVA